MRKQNCLQLRWGSLWVKEVPGKRDQEFRLGITIPRCLLSIKERCPVGKVTYVAGTLFLQDGTVLAIVVQSLSPVQLFVTPWTAAVQHSIDNNGYLGDRCRGSEVKTVYAFSAIFYFFTRGRGAHLRAQALEQSAWPWIRHLTSEHLGLLTYKLG